MHRLKSFVIRLDFLAFVCGVLIALQARVNGELSYQLNNSLQAAFVSFSSGLIVIILLVFFSRSIRLGLSKLVMSYQRKEIRLWSFIGGVLGGNLIAIQTFILPKIGVAVFSVGSIAGQTCISLLVDKLGITGGGKQGITLRRIFAAVITVSAVLISVLNRINVQTLSVFLVTLAIVSGSIIGVQRALNGKLNEYSNQIFATTFINFVGGTGILGIYLLFVSLIQGNKLEPLKIHPIWMYSGGVIGIVYIAFAATIVQNLGVLVFTLYSVGGQLMGSLILDLFLPVEGVEITYHLVAGIVLTFLGVFVGGVRSSRLKR